MSNFDHIVQGDVVVVVFSAGSRLCEVEAVGPDCFTVSSHRYNTTHCIDRSTGRIIGRFGLGVARYPTEEDLDEFRATLARDLLSRKELKTRTDHRSMLQAVEKLCTDLRQLCSLSAKELVRLL